MAWLQMRLGSGVAVAVVQAGSCSSVLTPSLGTSTCTGADLKRKEKTAKPNPTLTAAHPWVELLSGKEILAVPHPEKALETSPDTSVARPGILRSSQRVMASTVEAWTLRLQRDGVEDRG